MVVIRRTTLSRSRASNRRAEGRPRLQWTRAGAPPCSKRRLRRRTCRTLRRSASATCRFVMRPAQTAFTSPGRCSSFWLNVKVPMKGGHFHVAVIGGHFHVAPAQDDRRVDRFVTSELYSRERPPGGVMLTLTRSLPVNQPGQASLTRGQLWQALLLKVEDATLFVPGMTSCRVLERRGNEVFREIVWRGQPPRPRVTLPS